MQGQSPALSSLPDPETGFSRVGAGSPDSSGRREYQAAGAVRVSAEPTCSVASVLGVSLLPRWGRCLEGHPELPGLRVGGLHGCVSVCACGEASLCHHLTCQRKKPREGEDFLGPGVSLLDSPD